MFEIDKQRFGKFVAELRKEKGVTQKELAKELFISDKAIKQVGKRVFPKQKDIEEQPVFTCLQRKEYCY